MQIEIPHWRRGEPTLTVALSTTTRRAALLDPLAGLIPTANGHWPSPEIAQKCCMGEGRSGLGAFDPADHPALTEKLGYYSSLQSIASEDALTWNVFSPFVYPGNGGAHRPVREILRAADIDLPGDVEAKVWLWRRLPHPDTFTSGGPEIDIGIHAGDTLVLAEAKWLSKLGKGMGTDGTLDQEWVRRNYLMRVGQRLYSGVTRFVLLGISPDTPLFVTRDEELKRARLFVRNLTWRQVAEAGHPAREELLDHLEWKLKYGAVAT